MRSNPISSFPTFLSSLPINDRIRYVRSTRFILSAHDIAINTKIGAIEYEFRSSNIETSQMMRKASSFRKKRQAIFDIDTKDARYSRS